MDEDMAFDHADDELRCPGCGNVEVDFFAAEYEGGFLLIPPRIECRGCGKSFSGEG